MKKQVLLLLSLCMLGFITFAQNNVNLVVFSEDGEPFYAFINGVKQNAKPETNVKVTGVSPNISLRLEFEDKALPLLKQNMALEPGFEHTAKITRDMKKQLKLRYFGRVPLEESSQGIPTVAYHTSEDKQPAPAVENTPYNTAYGANTTVTSSTVTTATNNGNPNAQNGSVNVNVGGMGINMNVTGMEGNTINTTSSTTVTTTQSTSGNAYNSNNSNYDSPSNNRGQGRNNNGSNYQSNNNNTNNNSCRAPMSQANFSKLKDAVESKPFSDTKMSTAKVATKNACLSTNQVKEVCRLFSMDDDKLIYAKYAYEYCFDKANFYQVSEVFSFSTTTDEFNKFLEQ